MSENKIYKKLPAVLQTSAIKNFFESTVEQLFSKSNAEIINGFIGDKNLDNHKSSGVFIQEPTATREFYSLAPVVNTINVSTGQSENLIFFDEMIDTLKTYGVDVRNQNKLFGEMYYSYMPPVNVDKLVNYQEYYWSPQGPRTIDIRGSLENPIDIDRQVIGKATFTPAVGKTLRNGMVVRFIGDFVIPRSRVNIEYIVEGVGEEIYLIEKNNSFESFASTVYTENNDPLESYDASVFSLNDPNVSYSAGSITGVVIANQGIGYVNPTVSFVGANSGTATGTITLSPTGSVSNIAVTNGGTRYSDTIGVQLQDIEVTANVLLSQFTNNDLPIVAKSFIINSNTNILPGQVVTGFITGIVDSIVTTFDSIANAYVHTMTLEDSQTFNYVSVSGNPTISFAGRDFVGEVRVAAMHTITSSNVDILASQAVSGIDPVTGKYYLRGGRYAFDRDYLLADGTEGQDGEGDLQWGGRRREIAPDYLVIRRGARNNNVWSRINFWFHKDNFTDAGQDLPDNSFRARRPILEFDNKIELYNHGQVGVGAVAIACTELLKAQQYDSAGNPVGGGVEGMPSGTTIDGVPTENATVIFPNEESSVAKFVYRIFTNTTTGKLVVVRAGHPRLNPRDAVDGDINFVPWELEVGDTVQVISGLYNIGNEYYWTDEGLVLGQIKFTSNQAPLFMLYDDNGIALNDQATYPNSTFEGSPIFAYKVNNSINAVNDEVLGFPVSFRQFKASSEIEFENNVVSDTVFYTPQTIEDPGNVPGYYFYKIADKLETYWKASGEKDRQRIRTTYNIDQYDIDQQTTVFYIGGIPEVSAVNTSGYDIIVTVNGVIRTDFEYSPESVKDGFIEFDSFNFSLGDFIEVSIYSASGLLSTETISKFDLPLSWRENPADVTEILTISEPEYLPHFKKFMESQDGFEGDVLGSNNFDNTPKLSAYAKDITHTDQNLILGAFLLDDQPHNMIDALRFNAAEYEKYKNRLRKEINTYYNGFDVTAFSNDYVLERVLRNLISYRIGKDVFNRTYVIPFGDNYEQQEFVINNVATTEFVADYYADLNKIENGLLVYKTSGRDVTLLTVDLDYEIVNYNPITVRTTSAVSLQLSDVITFKIYDENRDSAQCPATPSVLGLYPLVQPEIVDDYAYATPVKVVVGHDGSKTLCVGDRRDEILLEFEKRIYNAAKAYFRAANSLPELNITAVKKGAFRNTGFENKEWFDLLRFSFANWVSSNNLDPIVNEYYNEEDEWTWNYRGSADLPGHWRGWMEYYYDTYEPHRHPWEMLGFFEKPLWWEEEYGTDYSSNNTALWGDLEDGIIRSGERENVTDDRYLTNNPFRREGLHQILPVDKNGELKSPYRIFSTGATSKTNTWTNLTDASALTSLASHAYKANSFLSTDGVNISFDANAVYVSSRALVNHVIDVEVNSIGHTQITEQDLYFSIPRTITASPSPMSSKGVGVLVNGLPLYNVTSTNTWNNENEWHYNNFIDEDHSGLAYGHIDDQGVMHYYAIDPIIVGLVDGVIEEDGVLKWDPTVHSPIVGWAFDGLPIYGPYGHREYNSSGVAVDDSITNIKSPFRLRQGTRTTGPAGAYTGVFVEDYDVDAAQINRAGYTNLYNARYGTTPDSPSTPIWFYVATIDDSGKPMFPYAVGGGVKSHTGSNVVWGATYLGTALEPTLNPLGTSPINESATPALTSVFSIELSVTGDVSAQWKFGDLAPVEYAWRSSPGYPYAVAEALLLAKPGAFATLFADPTNLLRPPANPSLLLNKRTRERWNFADTNAFRIHGTTDSQGNFITNIGYSQLINSWLAFQGLDQTEDFANKLRSLNIKLGHRMAGFVDANTMTVRTDQYSSSGKATSLIVPTENITVQIHNSPYKSRNFYSGVVVEKTANGFKIRGFDRNYGYFNVLESDVRGDRERIQVGGSPASFIGWEPNVSYKKGTIVQYQGAFYKAPAFIGATTTFDKRVWSRLPSLPQVGGASATLYAQTTGNVLRVDHETEFTKVEDVYDFMIGLGKYQASLGYQFDDFDPSINEVRNWAYAAKQFLFWTTGKWEIGNTLELSPLAGKIIFEAPLGIIAKINRTDREQFTILDQDGIAISPTDCEIIREDNRIELTPPAGKQVYAVMLFTKEIEHAMLVDNTTIFNDVIFNTKFNQRHTRFKVKATRTKDWKGRLTTSGFIVNGSELLPNLDNLAEGLGRYHEFGFIPVERELYRAARSMFGFTEKEYLRDLDISEDDQFEFYRGMLQGKGTSSALTRLARSNAVIQGNISVFDEWALRVADFGDTENDQSIELKLEKHEIVNDPQLITLAFPEDITGVVEKIDVVSRRYKYYTVPQIVISQPTQGTNRVQATAIAVLNSSNEIDRVIVEEPGVGYNIPIGVEIIAGDVVTDAIDTTLQTATALSTGAWVNVANLTTTSNIVINDHLSANGNIVVNLSNAVISNATAIADAINSTASLGGNVSASVFRSDANISGTVTPKYTLAISGKDFSIVQAAPALSIATGRYQPRQRYAVLTANATVSANISVTVDGTSVSEFVNGANISGGLNWEFDQGDRWSITTISEFIPSATPVFTLGTGSEHASASVASENNVIIDGDYPYLDLYINGVLVENQGLFEDSTLDAGHTRYQNIWSINGAGTELTLNIDKLPNEVKTYVPSQRGFVLARNSVITLIEKATIDFTNNYQGDLPGKLLNIVARVQDGIAIKLGTRRIYEITPELAGDDIILFDIDDPERFLKKPLGVRDNNLWPTIRTGVDFNGIDNKRFTQIPNAGYVNPGNVNFMAYSIADLPDLFDRSIIIKPSGGHTIHVAASENDDWNVYNLTPADASVSFLLQPAGQTRAKLLTNASLFSFLDSNMIGEADTTRYLDYFLTLKNANVSDNVVVWTNERIIQQKQAELSNVVAPRMIEARIKSIGPAPGSSIDFVDMRPVTTKIYKNVALTEATAANTLRITGFVNTSINENDAVTIIAETPVLYRSRANATFLSAGNVRLVSNASIPAEFTAPNTITLYSQNSALNAIDVYVESANISAGTLNINDTRFANSNVVVGMGNITYLMSVTPDYNQGNVETYYLATNVTPSSFEVSGPELAGVIPGQQYTGNVDNITSSGNGTITLTTTSFVPTTVKAPGSIILYTSDDPVANAKTYAVESITGGGFDANGQVIAANIAVRDVYFSNVNVTFTSNANVTFVSYGNVNIVSTAPIPANFTAPAYIRLLASGRETSSRANNRPVLVTAANTATNTFTVVNDGFFSTANITSNYGIKGYVFESPSTVIEDLGNVTFALTAPSFVEVRHMNKTKVVTDGTHSLKSGEYVRVFSNAFTGSFIVSSIPTSDSFVIDAPFTFSEDRTGAVTTRGMQIKTTDPHGISREYVTNRKRIAVHFAEPSVYNQMYYIDDVTPDSIIVKDIFTVEDTPAVFLDKTNGYASLNNKAIPITSDPMLTETTVLFTANMQLVPPNAYITNTSNIVMANSVLNSNANVLTGFTIVREIDVNDNRYPVLSTVDHTRVNINGIDIDINSLNSLQGTSDALNREMNLRRSMMGVEGNVTTVGFNMLRNFNTELPVPTTTTTASVVPTRVTTGPTATVMSISGSGTVPGGTLAPAYKINNYGPYVKDEAILQSLAGSDSITGRLVLSTGSEKQVDHEYNKGAIKIGPLKGFVYTDRTSGVTFMWDFDTGRYIRVIGALPYEADPNIENDLGLNVLNVRSVAGLDTASLSTFSDGTDSDEVIGEYEEDLAEVDEGVEDAPEVFDPPFNDETFPPLLGIAGNGVGSVALTSVGVKRAFYDFMQTRGGNVATSPNFGLSGGDNAFRSAADLPNDRHHSAIPVSIPRWRTSAVPVANGWIVEVWEIARNDQGKFYWILIDKVLPTSAPHNFWATINNNSEFYGLPKERFYYDTDTQWTGNTSLQVDIVSAYEDFYKDIPPVEPAFYIGRQLISEPFAVQNNGANATVTWVKMPPSTIGASAPNLKDTKITVNATGYNSFFMWAPGLTPGQWEPQQEGPGNLPGRAGIPTFWGYGRGYYAPNDSHTPASFSDVPVSNGPYPGYAPNGWTTRQPRFKYSKDFAVYPLRNNDISSLTGNVVYPYEENFGNPANTFIRADEIFVACFWTEPHTYERQLVGYNYNSVDAEGNPAPIYQDYQGTVTRVKYIRLNELPADAMLRRPIPDTGWAGRGWKNLITDKVTLPGEYSPVPGDADNPWSTFELTSTPGGSTGDDTPTPGAPRPPVTVGSVATAPAGGAGLGAVSNDLTEAAPLVLGKPVLTGGALESLPGPCTPNPVVVPRSTDFPCYNRPFELYEEVVTEKSNAVSVPGNIVHESHIVTVVGRNPFYVFFDFSGNTSNGITIEQSDDATFANVSQTNLVVDTQSTPLEEGGRPYRNDGKQIGKYGTTTIPGRGTNIISEVNLGLGITTATAISAENNLTFTRNTATSQRTDIVEFMPGGNLVGVGGGIGFVAKNIDCRDGQYVRITVSKGIDNRTGRYKLFVMYTGNSEELVDPNVGFLTTCPDKQAPSRAYREGARLKSFTFISKKKKWFGLSKKGRKDGYFGGGSDGNTDNIYYPYGASGGRAGKTVVGEKANGQQTGTVKGSTTISMPTVPTFTTHEFKGYYQAPVSGTYTFHTNSDDASYIWVSPEPDMVDDGSGKLIPNTEEFYKDNGEQSGNPKNYTIQNATVNNGGTHPPRKRSGTITLEGGKYYFIRGIFGNNKKRGTFSFTVTPPNGTETDVTFSGRKCPGDKGYVAPQNVTSATQDPTTGGTGTPGASTPFYNPAGIAPGYGSYGDYWLAAYPELNREDFRLSQKIGNYSGYSNQTMTGYNFMPSSFKVRNTRKVVDPQTYGFSVSLDNTRFVNATSQRVTGGFVIPLARTVKEVSRTPRPLSSQTITQQPWYRTSQLNMGTTLRAVNYNPKRVGSTFMLDSISAPITNVTSPVTVGGSAAGASDSGMVTLTPIGPTIPGIGVPASSGGVAGLLTTAQNVVPVQNYAVVESPDVDTPFENREDKITYTKIPTIDITPLTYTDIGSLLPAGRPAVAPIYRPTPAVTLPPEALATVPAGTSILINNKALTIPDGGSVNGLKAQINCAKIGVRADIDPVTGNLRISSCGEGAFSIKNGCAPGKLKSVADFHVSRGFEQSRTETEGTAETDRAVMMSAGNVDIEWSEYNLDNELEDIITLGNAILPSTTSTVTTSRSYTTGGSNYRVGDRLRVVGGTPVNNTQGPLTYICVDDPGYGYTDPANLKVIINPNGSVPGVGAAAIVTELDTDGGVASIEILNYGIGYDVNDPPEIQIVDIGERFADRYATINTSAMTPAIYTRGDILFVQDVSTTSTSIDIAEKWYRVTAANVTIGATTFNASAPAAFVGNSNVKISGNVTNVKANSWVTMLFSGVNAYANAANNHNFYVSNVNVADSTFTINDRFFANANVVGSLGNVRYTVTTPFNDQGLTRIADPRRGKKAAMAHGRIGVDPTTIEPTTGDTNVIARNRNEFLNGFKSLAGPLRVAKFLVTGVDDDGAITSLRILDRGLYKVFPADLTQGIPLEYDNEAVGLNTFPNQALGVVDPLRDNLEYGPNHPEYQVAPFVDPRTGQVLGKHPDWADLQEFRQVINQDGTIGYEPYNGTPGAYDPLTYVYIPELNVYLSKQQLIDTDRASIAYGEYIEPREIAGGTGARVFLTAMEMPDCSERGRAKEILGLPDSVSEINVPESLAFALNNALSSAGYRPDDIRFEVEPIGPGVEQLKLVTPGYPGVNIGTSTPGFPDTLGIPTGDYFAGALCIQATLSTPDLTANQAVAQLEELYKSNTLGLLTPEQESANYGIASGRPLLAQPQILSLLCVDQLKTDPNSWFGNLNKGKLGRGVPVTAPGAPTGNGGFNGGTGINGAGGDTVGDGDVVYIQELYEYDIQNIFGDPVTLSGPIKQNTNVFVFESKRYANENIVEEDDDLELFDFSLEPKLWIDNFGNPNNVAMPGFVKGGWAYLEYGVPKRWQTGLVDTSYIKNAIMYHSDTGEKLIDFDFWDPFKGIIPAFIRNEIHYVNTHDPVNYNNARTDFGRNNIGKVWWDTSTLRYMWYEQGDNIERWLNWGRTFPGSTVTLCEWVESRALPQNWTGDGTPRWLNQFITERHFNPETEKYENYYYFWVQNRTKLDSRVARKLGRKQTAENLARYIANPAGYGLNLISFVSENSFVLSNIAQEIPEDEGIIQINLSRNLNSDGIKHTAWKLLREGDNNSLIPDHLSDKLIDSLCGDDAVGNVVPDPILSEVEKYGIAFRPRQTMFKDLREARRVMAYALTEILADIKLETTYPNWDSSLIIDDTTLVKRTSWYAVQYTDLSTNTKIRYNNSYKPVYNVSSINELEANLDVPDGTVLQVKGSTGDRPQLWKFNSETGRYELIAITDETVYIDQNVLDLIAYEPTGQADESSPDTISVRAEIRAFLIALRDNVFANSQYWNKFFFEMMKYAYLEQKQLSWAFKTSYIYVEKDEEDLVEIIGFKPDNFDKVIEYMNEVKPFTAKIREYKDGKRAPQELIGSGMISDFDKPPYADPNTGSVRTLDDYSEEDAVILGTDSRYANYNSAVDKSELPFRHNNTTLVFDRTNWRLTQFNFNANTTTINRSIARNIANLNLESSANVAANVYTRAVDRIFKLDATVQESFVTEVNAHFGDTTSGSNTTITTNADILTNIIDAGNLNVTLEMVKDKVGGNFRGDIVDANVFTKFVQGLDSTTDYITNFGHDTAGWDTFAFDENIDVFNYEGIFSEAVQGNITFRRNNTTYEGFDGVTFKRVLYGEERPEELVMLSPLESLIVRVTTSIYPNGNSQTISNVTTTIASFDGVLYDASNVTFYTLGANIAFNSNGVVTFHNANVFYLGNTNVTFPADRNTAFPALVQLLVNGNILTPQGTTLSTVYEPTANANTYFYVNSVNADVNTFTVHDDYFTSANTSALAGANIQFRVGVYSPISLFDEAITTSVLTEADPVSNAASNVSYQIHQNLFGKTEYLRILDANKTVLTSNIFAYSTEITVEDGSIFPDPKPLAPGVLWVGSERILYDRKLHNTFSGLTRGSAGTTAQDWIVTDLAGAPITIEVFDGSVEESFDDLNPEANVWLDASAVSLADFGNANIANTSSIMKFLHNL
jgi:hypothetical protein